MGTHKKNMTALFAKLAHALLKTRTLHTLIMDNNDGKLTCIHSHSLTHSLTHSHAYILTHSLTHSHTQCIHSFIRAHSHSHMHTFIPYEGHGHVCE